VHLATNQTTPLILLILLVGSGNEAKASLILSDYFRVLEGNWAVVGDGAAAGSGGGGGIFVERSVYLVLDDIQFLVGESAIWI